MNGEKLGTQLTPEVQQAIESSVKRRLDEERAFLAQTIGLSAKIAGGALAIALGAVTFFGIRNFGDLGERIDREAKETIEKFLKDSAPQDLERRLKDLYLASLISFHQGLGGREPVSEEFNLSLADGQSLVKVLSASPVSDSIFRGAIAVLADSVDQSWWPKVEDELASLAAGDNAELEVSRRTDLRVQLIDLLAATDSTRAFQKLKPFVQASGVEADVRAATFRYAERINASISQPDLEAAVRSEESSLRIPALRMLARNHSTAPTLQEYVKRILAGPKDRDNLREAAGVADVFSDGENALMKEASLSLLAFIIDAGGRVGVPSTLDDEMDDRLVIYWRAYENGRPSMTKFMSTKVGTSVLARLDVILATRASAAKTDGFRRCVAAVRKVRRPGSLPGRYLEVHATFEEDAGLSRQGKLLFQDGRPSGAVLIVESGPPANGLIAEWDTDGGAGREIKHHQSFDGFVHPEHIQFSTEIVGG